MDVTGKITIVTGASSGIGEATAKLLARHGAKIVLAARSTEKIEALAKELPGSIAITTDMTDQQSVKNLIAETKAQFGRIDLLINNAGQGLYGPIEKVSVDDYRYILELNVVGPLTALQEVIPIMRAQGGGTVVNISSMVSKNYFQNLGAYASTKYALNALSLTARKELAADNISVSIMLPALTDTNFGVNARKASAREKSMESRNRTGMPGADSPEYIAERVLYAIESGEAEVLAH
jgi:short-subunit dehydrogenase